VTRTTRSGVELISTFGRLVEVYNRLEHRFGRSLEEQCGIPHSWYEVFLRISRADDGLVTLGSLAEQVALTTGGITRMLDRMVDAGYVERVPCPTDRRVSFAALTPAGRKKLEEATAVNVRDLEAAFAGFGSEELASLDGLLDRLRTRADEMPPAGQRSRG
jgi:MarR family 2-MHQ and catechol resistance regulon transcriptional repressor